MGYWSFIVPEATVNYLANPSLETGTTGYSNYATGTASGSRAQSSAWSKRGVYSELITKSGGGASDEYGVYADASTPGSFLAGEYVTFGVDLNIVSGTVRIKVEVTAGTTISTTVDVTASGRSSVTVGPIVGTVTQVRVWVYVISATGSFYADGLQVERKAYATTYCDGTREDCTWSGTPHGSTSSRPASTRAGGREINLDSYTCYVKESAGIGMPAARHRIQAQALLSGAQYRGQHVEQRVFNLAIMLPGSSRTNLHSLRKALIDALKPDAVPEEQPVILRYSGANASKPVEISVIYDSGLEFSPPDGFTDEINLRLIAYDPFWVEDGDAAAILDTADALATADYIVKRNAASLWSGPGGGLNGLVYCMAVGLNGHIYMGGSFTNAGGIAAADYIAEYDPSNDTFAALGSGMDARVRAMVVGADGSLYVGGNFTSAGGVANTAYLARWDGSAWQSLATTGANAEVMAVSLGLDNTLYIGGLFTAVNGVAYNQIAQRSAAGVWSALGTGTGGGAVYALTCGPDGRIYAAGGFAPMGGISGADGVAYWESAAWHAMGAVAGGGAAGWSLAVAPNGDLILGGTFTSVGGVAANYIARWNRYAWSALGTGMNSIVYALGFDADGLLYAGGSFHIAGGITVANALARWNDSVWMHVGMTLPGGAAANVLCFAQHANGDFYIGYNQSGSLAVPGRTTVTPAGTRTTYPVITLKRSGGTTAVAQLLYNETTGALLLLNYALADGETLTITLEPSERSCVSSLWGPVWRAMFQASDLATFYLLPGSNVISAFVSTTGSPTLTATIQWRNLHWSSDGVAA